MDKKMFVLLEIFEADWKELQEEIKKTPKWEYSNNSGICLATNPEYQEDVFLISAEVSRIIRPA